MTRKNRRAKSQTAARPSRPAKAEPKQASQPFALVFIFGGVQVAIEEMASWWQPTAANYFARIKKDQILQAIQEATGAPVKERLRSLKKQDPAEEAEKSVTGTRWLPELLRK